MCTLVFFGLMCEYTYKVHHGTNKSKSSSSSSSSTSGKTLQVYSEDEYSSLFEKFKHDFQKVYSDTDEEDYRFGIFKDNLQVIDELNEAALADNRPTQYAITRWTDKTKDEFSSGLGLKSLDDKDSVLDSLGFLDSEAGAIADYGFISDDACAACVMFPEFEEFTKDNLPVAFDWRDYGAVTSVKNQADCGSCWTFSTTGDIEGVAFLQNGELLSLSEQQLLACDTADDACDGGYPFLAMRYAAVTGRLLTNDEYEYHDIDMHSERENDNPATCDEDKVTEDSKYASILGYHWIADYKVTNATVEEDLAYYLIKNGPLSICLNADSMQYYDGGIDRPTYASCPWDGINHAVLLVGWGQETYADNTEVIPYWIIKNSWNSTWGEEGYYYVERGINACGLTSQITHSVALTNDPDDAQVSNTN